MHHAVVALASLHEAFNDSTECRPGSDWYGLNQYCKSLAGLNRHMSTTKYKSVDIVLICCVLFITFESLRGDYDTAGQNLQSGLKILSHPPQYQRSLKFIHDHMISVFVRLYVQLVSITDSNFTLNDHTAGGVYMPQRFSGLGEARNKFIAS